MFMNSINKDTDYYDNSEANNFVFVDRFVVNKKDWQKDLSQVQNMSKHLRFEDKVDKLWWRGAPSSDNNTVFAKFGTDRPASTMENIMTEKLYNNLLFQSIFLMSFLILVGLLIPNWLVFVITKAIAYGLVGLGIITLMRGGLVSFGQGFVFGIGGVSSVDVGYCGDVDQYFSEDASCEV